MQSQGLELYGIMHGMKEYMKWKYFMLQDV
jgi:hypothetical protein